MQTPEGYTFTAVTALNITEKMLTGKLTPGIKYPKKPTGADLILELEGVNRK